MKGKAPPFWWKAADWRAWALSPVSAVYGAVAGRRLRKAPRVKVAAPVLCVGNLTVGGAGKTPVAIALGQEAARRNLSPGFLSRGHGGSSTGPHAVEHEKDNAAEVGDEPLLLAAVAPTVVSKDRLAGAELLISKGCDFIVMDDGFQSVAIHIDYALVVVDGDRGIGNGHVFPAGPLRARLVDQLRHADALLRLGDGEAGAALVRHAARAAKPVLHAARRTRAPRRYKGKEFVAFAGIGDPDKFFATVTAAGGKIVSARPFPDHHPYTVEEARALLAAAAAAGCDLVTTAKDVARLRDGPPALRELASRARVVEIEIDFQPPETAGACIAETLAAYRRRMQHVGALSPPP